MYQGNSIAVVVPAYNEELLISQTLKSIPDYIDKIYVVDDGSNDRTLDIIEQIASNNKHIIPISHEVNRGVGASIVSGYQHSLRDNIDITVVMAGDAQMDPIHIPQLIQPILENKADYTKGNRLLKVSHMKGMSPFRKIGNSILTMLTKVSSGYYDLMDPQNGYTAITKRALATIELDEIYPKYGYCNDLLCKLNVFNFSAVDVSIPAKYGSEKSKIKYGRYIVKVSWLLLNNFLYRQKMKYIFQDLSPIPFLFLFGIILIPYGFYTLIYGHFNPAFGMSLPILILGLQLMLIATVLDINYSKYHHKPKKEKKL